MNEGPGNLNTPARPEDEVIDDSDPRAKFNRAWQVGNNRERRQAYDTYKKEIGWSSPTIEDRVEPPVQRKANIVGLGNAEGNGVSLDDYLNQVGDEPEEITLDARRQGVANPDSDPSLGTIPLPDRRDSRGAGISSFQGRREDLGIQEQQLEDPLYGVGRWPTWKERAQARAEGGTLSIYDENATGFSTNGPGPLDGSFQPATPTEDIELARRRGERGEKEPPTREEELQRRFNEEWDATRDPQERQEAYEKYRNEYFRGRDVNQPNLEVLAENQIIDPEFVARRPEGEHDPEIKMRLDALPEPIKKKAEEAMDNLQKHKWLGIFGPHVRLMAIEAMLDWEEGRIAAKARRVGELQDESTQFGKNVAASQRAAAALDSAAGRLEERGIAGAGSLRASALASDREANQAARKKGKLDTKLGKENRGLAERRKEAKATAEQLVAVYDERLIPINGRLEDIGMDIAELEAHKATVNMRLGNEELVLKGIEDEIAILKEEGVREDDPAIVRLRKNIMKGRAAINQEKMRIDEKLRQHEAKKAELENKAAPWKQKRDVAVRIMNGEDVQFSSPPTPEKTPRAAASTEPRPVAERGEARREPNSENVEEDERMPVHVFLAAWNSFVSHPPEKIPAAMRIPPNVVKAYVEQQGFFDTDLTSQDLILDFIQALLIRRNVIKNKAEFATYRSAFDVYMHPAREQKKAEAAALAEQQKREVDAQAALAKQDRDRAVAAKAEELAKKQLVDAQAALKRAQEAVAATSSTGSPPAEPAAPVS